MTTFNVGVNPSDLAIFPNGQYAYVTNSNNYGIPGSDTVTVLNLETGFPETTISDPSLNEPYRVAIDSKGRYAYVCNSGTPAAIGEDGTVSIIDCHTDKVIGVIKGFDGPGDIVLTRSKAYVTNYGAPGGVSSGNGTTVSVVNLKSRRIIDTIQVDLAPSALKLSEDGKYLYVTCYVDGNPGTGKLKIVNTETNAVENTIEGLFGPFGIDLSECGRYAYVTNFGSNNFAPYGTTVSVIDLKKRRILSNIEVGIQPAAIVATRKYVYVTLYNALYADANFQNLTFGKGTLVTISTKTHKIVHSAIPLGAGPSGIAKCNDKLYVTLYSDNIVRSLNI